jgi:hypothetical protein
MSTRFQSGIYMIENREKYKGKMPIVYRSNYEHKYMIWLDRNPNILEWASESLVIPYLNPVKNKISKYYPDFIITVKDGNGSHIEIIEIKPFRQTIPPKITKGKRKSTLLIEGSTWAINCAKWKAANEYCRIRNFKFVILTENELGIRK